MTKKNLQILFLSIFIFTHSPLFVKDAYAQFTPPLLWTIVLDAITDIGKVISAIGNAVDKVQDSANLYIKGVVNKAQSVAKSFTSKFTGIFKSKKRDKLPGQKDLATCDMVDNSSKDSVKDYVCLTFFTYPSDQPGMEDGYRQKAKEFYQDSIIEIYTVSKELEKQLDILEAATLKISESYEEGKDGAEKPESLNSALVNYYNTYDTMDKLIQMLEELTALKAQYEAAKAINDNIKPMEYEKGKKGCSLEIITNRKFASSETLTFAQVTTNEVIGLTTSEKKAVVRKVKSSPTIEEIKSRVNGQGLVADDRLGFVDAPPSPGAKSPYHGADDLIAQMAKITPVYNLSVDTLDIHNLINSLPSHRDIFKKYQQYIRLHQKALEALETSDQCAINYIGRYYDDPVKVWEGRPLKGMTNLHDLRSGLSAYAINLFTVTKASQAMLITEDDIGEVRTDVQGDVTDVTTAEKQKIDKKSATLKKPSKEEEVSKEARKLNLLSWKIGSDVSRKMVQDQYFGENKWGHVKKRFPVWNDQKNYYKQYLDGKYQNIKQYLSETDLRKDSISLALVLNDLYSGKSKGDNRKRLEKVSKELDDILKASAEKESQAIESLLQGKKDAIEQETKAKDAKIKTLNERKDAIFKRLDAENEILISYSEKINDAKGKAQESQIEADSLEVNKKNLEEFYKGDTGVREIVVNKLIEVEKEEITKQKPDVEIVHDKKTETSINPFYNEDTKPKENINNVERSIKTNIIEGDNKIKVKENITTYETPTFKQKAVKKEYKIEVIDNNPDEIIDEEATPEEQLPEKRSHNFGSELMIFADITTIAETANAKPVRKAFSKKQVVVEELPKEIVQEVDDVEVEASKDIVDRIETVKTLEPGKAEIRTSVVKTITANTPKIEKKSSEKKYIETEVETPRVVYTPKEEITNKVKYTKTIKETMEVEADTKGVMIGDVDLELGMAEKSVKDNNQEVKRLTPAADNQQKKVTDLRQQVEQVDAEISKVEEEYSKKVKEIEDEYQKKLEETDEAVYGARQKELKNRKSLDSIYDDIKGDLLGPILAKLPIGTPFTDEVPDLIKDAEGAVYDTRQYADFLIDQTLNEYYSSGDEIYFPDAQDKIIEIHGKLIEELKAMQLAGMTSFSKNLAGLAPEAQIYNIISNVYNKTLVESICAEDRCLKPDKDYFIGAKPKIRDFTAPKAGPASYYAPVREVFFFDDIDYGQIKKDKEGFVTEEAFLKYGGDMPEIWKLILRRGGFVEKPVDIKEILQRGGEGTALISGGRYPCNYDKYFLAFDADKDQYLVSESRNKEYNECVDIKIEGSLGYYSILDIESDVRGTATNKGYIKNLKELLGIELKEPDLSVESNTSELGTLLGMKMRITSGGGLLGRAKRLAAKASMGASGALVGDGKSNGGESLAFAATSFKVFQRIAKVAEEQGKNSKFKTNLRDETFKKAMLDHNQIGSFLKFVEKEKDTKQAKEELAINVADSKKKLFEALRKAGFEPDENLDLAKSEDYDLVKNKLSEFKDRNVKQMNELIKDIDPINNEIVEERLKKLNRILTGLQKDKDELISLSEVTDSGSALDAKIKAEEVNNKAMKEYEKRADDEFEKALRTFMVPYCAVY